MVELELSLKWIGRSTGAASSLTVAMPSSGITNSHFQSSDTTSTTSGFTSAGKALPAEMRSSER